MRVRICLDVSKPLLRGKRLSLGLNGSYWVKFSYEHLLEFCYMACQMEATDAILLPYGQWLRDFCHGSPTPYQIGRRKPSKVVHLNIEGHNSDS